MIKTGVGCIMTADPIGTILINCYRLPVLYYCVQTAEADKKSLVLVAHVTMDGFLTLVSYLAEAFHSTFYIRLIFLPGGAAIIYGLPAPRSMRQPVADSNCHSGHHRYRISFGQATDTSIRHRCISHLLISLLATADDYCA